MNFVIDSFEKLRNIFIEANNLLKKGSINVAIESCSKPKTLPQLRFVWGILIDDVYQYYTDSGYLTEISKTQGKKVIKKILYNECSTCEGIICPLTGKAIYHLTTMSDMQKEDMTAFINRILEWCAELGIILRPEARYLWMLHLSPAEIQEAKELILPERCPEYLAYIRKSYCIISGEYQCDAHHVKDGKYCNMNSKSPDWYTLPIKHNYHVKAIGHITTAEILRKTDRVLNGMELELFCRLCFIRWKYSK